MVQHKGKHIEICHDGQRSAGEVFYAAFYADCTHELTPIAEGMRLVLVYNLVQSAPAPVLAPPDERSSGVRETLQEAVGKWARWKDYGDLEKLAWTLVGSCKFNPIMFNELMSALEIKM